jgi:hypothetical protein
MEDSTGIRNGKQRRTESKEERKAKKNGKQRRTESKEERKAKHPKNSGTSIAVGHLVS